MSIANANRTGAPAANTAPRGAWHNAPVRELDFHGPDRLPVSVMGAHGGAGATTVARLLHAPDIGRRWPLPDQEVPPRVLLVGRTHAAGLMAISQALAGYCATEHPDGPFLTGIVLVPDAPGRLPKPLRRRITVLESAAMVHKLPWIAGWRLSDTAYDQRLADHLRAFAEGAALTCTPAKKGELS